MALSTMYEGKNNSPQTDITSAITAADQIIPVTDISVFPDAPNLATIGNDEDAEVIRYNGIEGSTLTGCERGFGGTTAKQWESATVISRQITKYDLDTLRGNIQDLEDRKQDTLTFDSTPTTGSTNPVTSNGIKTALDGKQDNLTFDSTPDASSINPVTSRGIYTAIHGRALYISMPSTSTLGQISNPAITTTMRVVNIVWGTPSNVASNVSWNTNTAGKLILSGTLSGPTTAEIDLIDFG